jgi:hypothetical protein
MLGLCGKMKENGETFSEARFFEGPSKLKLVGAASPR